MAKVDTNFRHYLIITKLRTKPSTLKEISEYLEEQGELKERKLTISRRTFLRDIEDIAEMYQIEIKYDHSNRVYKIDYELQDDMKSRLLESFEIFNALNVKEELSSFMHFERRKPRGTENLYGLLHAIKNNYQIHFNYHKFWGNSPIERHVEPLALKEFKNNWYLLARDQKDNMIKTFGLDRIDELDIIKKKFEYPKDFDIEDQFRYCFGIMGANGEKPLEVELSFKPFQGKYIKMLPLHETQQVLIDNDKELRVKLKICITIDFTMELLSYAENLKVIKPKALIDKMKEKFTKALNNYDLNRNC